MMNFSQKIVLGVICVASCFASAYAFAARDFDAAGVLLVAREGDTVYVLLGRDRFRAWYEMFAGRPGLVQIAGDAHRSRRESAYETAIRECHEESGGYLTQSLLRKLVDPSQVIREGSFVFFKGEIEKFPVVEMKSAVISAASPAFREMADFAWVPVQNVLSSENVTVTDDSGRHIRVRRELKSRLERARTAGWF